MPAPTFPDIPPTKDSPGESTKYRTRRAKFGDAYEQAVVDGINAQEVSWKLSFENLATASISTIKAFLDSRAGSLPFWWTPPGGTALLWTCEEHERTDYGPNSSTLRCTFNRWFGAEE